MFFNWNFQRGGGGGGPRKNLFCGEGKDTFWNHTLQFNEIKIYSLYCKSQLKT